MKRGWKITITIVACIAALLLVIRFVGSPIAKLVIENNSEAWIGRQVSIGSLSVSALTGRVHIKDLHVTDECDTTEFVGWQDLSVSISLPRLIGKHVYLRHIHLTDFNVNIWSDGSRFNFSDLPQRFSSDDSTAVQDTTPSAWRISLNDIRLHEGNFAYDDKSRAQHWQFEHLHLVVPGLQFGAGQTDAGLRFDLPDDAGTVILRGAYNMQSNMYSLIADLHNIDLHTFMPLAQDYLATEGLDGMLGAHLVAHGILDDVTGVEMQGNINIDGLDIRDKDRKSVAEVDRIDVGIKRIALKDMTLDFDSVVIDSMALNITRDKQGNTISRLLSPEKKELPQATDTTATATEEESATQSSFTGKSPSLNIGMFALRNSNVNYTDKTLFSKFNYRIRALSATAKDLTLDGQNHILLNASLPKGGSMMLNLRGSLNIMKKDSRIVAMLRNVQLEDLSPWTEYMFAYPVKKGTLSLTSDNSLQKGQIDGLQKIEIFDLHLGRKQNRLDAELKNIPLKSAVALMTDVNGKILLEVPVVGDLKEPKFSLGKVIGLAIGNLILKATAAPFVAMAQAHNINAGDLSQMSINLMQPDLGLEQYQKLDLIAQMMHEQDDLSLKMTQQFNLKHAIEEQALFNIKREYYKHSNSDAIGSLTLLDIEKIQKIANTDPQFRQYADPLLPKRGTLTARAVEYYTQDSLESQVLRQAEIRNRILTRYMTKQQDIREKRITITTDSRDNLMSYKGQERYEVTSEMKDEE